MDNKQAIEDIKEQKRNKEFVYNNLRNKPEEEMTQRYIKHIQALDKAIASIECIDEIIELIKNSSDKQYRNNGHWIYIGDKKGLADVLDIINKHLKEIEE